MHFKFIYISLLLISLYVLEISTESDSVIKSNQKVDDDFDQFEDEGSQNDEQDSLVNDVKIIVTEDYLNDSFDIEGDEPNKENKSVKIIEFSDESDIEISRVYLWESFIVFLCTSYITIYVIGKLKNEAIAEYWYRLCFRQFLQEFSLIGNYENDSAIEEINNNTIEHRKLQIQKETDCLFRLWLSGRKSIQSGLLIELRLSRRFCGLQLLLNLGRKYSMADFCTYTIDLDKDSMDTFVLFVCCNARFSRKIVTRRASCFTDISQFCIERKCSKYKLFSAAYGELSEPLDMLDSDARLKAAVNRNMIRYIYISDRYLAPSTANDVVDTSTNIQSILFIEFALGIDDVECFNFAVYLLDKLTQFRLSRESKQRAIRNRQVADEHAQRAVSKQKQEIAKQRRDEKRKELMENDPEQVRKIEEKQNKKEIRKKQQKVKAMMVRSF